MKTILPHTASDFCVEDECKTKKTGRVFLPLYKEEFDKLVNSSTEKLEKALERGRQDRLAAERAYRPPSISNLRFK